uniref:Uncharacterized protein n=1 Tax=Anguilla anguilla TaxID=7936 RepID=A0A0E9QD29_ANGAN
MAFATSRPCSTSLFKFSLYMCPLVLRKREKKEYQRQRVMLFRFMDMTHLLLSASVCQCASLAQLTN